MKKNTIPFPALIVLLLAVLAAAGSRTFLGPCVHEDGSFGACHWAGQAVFGSALLLAAESAAVLVWNDTGMRRGLYLSMLMTAVLGFLFPGTLIDLCHMATMHCRALMRPAMMLIFGLAGLVSLIGCMILPRTVTR